MNLREQAITHATPEQAWALLADPRQHARWNPKITATELYGFGEPALGTRFGVTYVMSGPPAAFDGEITAFEPLHRFAITLRERNQTDAASMNRRMVEAYTLEPCREGTRIIHDVQLDFAGVNPLLKALIWFITRTGRPTGPTYVETLAKLAEQRAA